MTRSNNLELRAPLFVPGNMPERFDKAAKSAADAVILDLEDAVAFEVKGYAREAVKGYLNSEVKKRQGNSEPLIGVRINAATSEEFNTDTELLRSCITELDFIVLPMISSPADVDALVNETTGELTTFDIPILALIESSIGILNCLDIARHPNVELLAFGSADLSSELEIEPTQEGQEFLFARSQLVLASAAARLPKPLDAPYMNVHDLDGLRRNVSSVLALGMGGKLCIHPNQVGAVIETMVPSQQDYERAQAIVQAFEESEARGQSSIRLHDGTFIDYPIAARARRRVQLYEK